MNKIEASNQVVVFNDIKIRRIFHEDEWWFSIIDVIGVLSESKNPRRYWSDLKRQLTEEWKNRDVGGEKEYAILTAA